MRQTRVRPAIALPIGIVVAIGLGYAYSYEPDEHTAYLRAAAAQHARQLAIEERENEARVAAAARAERERAAKDSVNRLVQDSIARAARREACGPAEISDWTECRPVTIGGRKYVVAVEIKGYQPGDPQRKWIRVHDDSGRVLYKEDGSGPVELSVRTLEDAGGRLRGLLFKRLPGANGQGRSYQIVVPRGDGWRPLAPPFSEGELEELVDEAQPDRLRLLDGDHFPLRLGLRGLIEAVAAYRVDFACESGAPSCVAIDSVHGLVRFLQVEFDGDAHWRPVDSTVTIDMFPAPHAQRSERVSIPPGATIHVLEGAGHMDDSDRARDDDWLHIRVGQQSGWIHGAKAFTAIYEVKKRYYRFGKPAGVVD